MMWWFDSNKTKQNKKPSSTPDLYNNVMEKKRIALRKLLEAVEKEILRKPDRKTLDHLSLLAGFQDWESFQKAIHGETSADDNYK